MPSAEIAAKSESFRDQWVRANVANAAGWVDQDIWDIEDEEVREAARLDLQQLTPSPATPAR